MSGKALPVPNRVAPNASAQSGVILQATLSAASSVSASLTQLSQRPGIRFGFSVPNRSAVDLNFNSSFTTTALYGSISVTSSVTATISQSRATSSLKGDLGAVNTFAVAKAVAAPTTVTSNFLSASLSAAASIFATVTGGGSGFAVTGNLEALFGYGVANDIAVDEIEGESQAIPTIYLQSTLAPTFSVFANITSPGAIQSVGLSAFLGPEFFVTEILNATTGNLGGGSGNPFGPPNSGPPNTQPPGGVASAPLNAILSAQASVYANLGAGVQINDVFLQANLVGGFYISTDLGDHVYLSASILAATSVAPAQVAYVPEQVSVTPETTLVDNNILTSVYVNRAVIFSTESP